MKAEKPWQQGLGAAGHSVATVREQRDEPSSHSPFPSVQDAKACDGSAPGRVGLPTSIN